MTIVMRGIADVLDACGIQLSVRTATATRVLLPLDKAPLGEEVLGLVTAAEAAGMESNVKGRSLVSLERGCDAVEFLHRDGGWWPMNWTRAGATRPMRGGRMYRDEVLALAREFLGDP